MIQINVAAQSKTVTSIAEKEALNFDLHQVRQAETQLKAADGYVVPRMPEAYQSLLVPVQITP